jgi:hypothetical protein
MPETTTDDDRLLDSHNAEFCATCLRAENERWIDAAYYLASLSEEQLDNLLAYARWLADEAEEADAEMQLWLHRQKRGLIG